MEVKNSSIFACLPAWLHFVISSFIFSTCVIGSSKAFAPCYLCISCDGFRYEEVYYCHHTDFMVKSTGHSCRLLSPTACNRVMGRGKNDTVKVGYGVEKAPPVPASCFPPPAHLLCFCLLWCRCKGICAIKHPTAVKASDFGEGFRYGVGGLGGIGHIGVFVCGNCD